MKRVCQAVLILIAVFWLGMPSSGSAQSPGGADRETIARGEAWFYQRCSVCHLGRVLKNETFEPMAPSLSGVLKDASPRRESAVLQQIQRGSIGMPGFRYGLTTQELDELMAYLKTL